MDLQQIKSDCATTLLGKEKSNQLKLQDLQKQVVDLTYENQKYIQKINDMEQSLQLQLADLQSQH